MRNVRTNFSASISISRKGILQRGSREKVRDPETHPSELERATACSRKAEEMTTLRMEKVENQGRFSTFPPYLYMDGIKRSRCITSDLGLFSPSRNTHEHPDVPPQFSHL